MLLLGLNLFPWLIVGGLPVFSSFPIRTRKSSFFASQKQPQKSCVKQPCWWRRRCHSWCRTCEFCRGRIPYFANTLTTHSILCSQTAYFCWSQTSALRFLTSDCRFQPATSALRGQTHLGTCCVPTKCMLFRSRCKNIPFLYVFFIFHQKTRKIRLKTNENMQFL